MFLEQKKTFKKAVTEAEVDITLSVRRKLNLNDEVTSHAGSYLNGANGIFLGYHLDPSDKNDIG